MRARELYSVVAIAGLMACAGGRDGGDGTGHGPLGKGDSLADSCQPSRLMLILDRSSSMQTGIIDGETKWSTAVDALDAVTAEFEDQIELGLMMFPSPDQCSPGSVFVEPALRQRSAIVSQLADPPPDKGNWTPMAQTLDAARSEPSLAQGSGRYAVLITDGWQWCSPYDESTRFAPVDSVEDLTAAGVTTYVVGFGGAVDALTLNTMAVKAGTARPGCNPDGDTPDAANPCYFQADSPLELQEALRDIAVTVSGEVCDGIDNDCDGNVDEGLSRACETNCGAGTETCVAGAWLGCDAPPEETDVCDGDDNDCDGVTDPGCDCIPGDTQPCGNQPNAGTCHNGQQTCLSDGTWSDCQGEVGPSQEICDNLDNDCNGTTDDVDAEEVCDNLDNDCDGKIDEDVTRSCYTWCGSGQEVCANGQWGECDAPPELPEVCDGEDNDCNGTTDDGCDCIPGETMECGESSVGECRFGTKTCRSDGTWGNCEGDVRPTTESCDGLDNDCDNKIDELMGDNDDVTSCPRGDENPEPPSNTDDPPPPSEYPAKSGGCSVGESSSGTGASVILMIGLALLGFRRRQD